MILLHNHENVTDNKSIFQILSITHLIQDFTDENTIKFKQCLLKELKCQNDREFICKILPIIYRNMSYHSIDMLQSTAMLIANSQTCSSDITINNKDNLSDCCSYTTSETNHNNNKMAMKSDHKSISDGCSSNGDYSYLSTMENDTLNIVASYLSKRQCIELSFVCKHLYLATQQSGYLAQSHNDESPLKIDDLTLYRLLWSSSNALAYSFASNVHLNIRPYSWCCDNNPIHIQTFYTKRLLRSNWFSSICSRLTSLYCESITSLKYLPVDALFGCKRKNNDYNYKYLGFGGIIVYKEYDKLQMSQIMRRFCDEIRDEHKNNKVIIHSEKQRTDRYWVN